MQKERKTEMKDSNYNNKKERKKKEERKKER